MIDTLHIDDLDGAVTLFKSTDKGTETIAVFDEEHREVIQDLLAEVKRLEDQTWQANADYVELEKEVKRLLEQFKLAYDWVDMQFPDGGVADFAKYIGDEEE
jgi:ABC-type nitrate/sulfonate/bicarbonate transport system substrate-binding protein